MCEAGRYETRAHGAEHDRECGDCAHLENTFERCLRWQKRVGCAGTSKGYCVFDCSKGNCYIGPSGGRWFAEPKAQTWSLKRFPDFPDVTRVKQKKVEVQRTERSAGKSLLIEGDGGEVLLVGDGVELVIGARTCHASEIEVSAPTTYVTVCAASV